MNQFPESRTLLQRVANRMYVQRLAAGAYAATIGLAVVYTVLLLVSRLTGLIPDWFVIPSIGLIPILGLLLATAWIRRPADADAARRIDDSEDTEDLYLTLTMIDQAAGEYQPLVARDAERKADGIEPVRVVPWRWDRQLLHLAGILALLVAGILWLPALDPFGKVAQAKVDEIRREELEKSRKATSVRKSQLAKSDVDQETSEDVEKSLDDLQETLRRAKPQQRQENARALAVHQKALGEKWRFNAEQLKHLLNRKPMDQRFGSLQRSQSQKWLRQLKEGSPEALEQELEQLQKDLQSAMKKTDPLERTEAMRRLQKKLDEMRQFAEDEANSKPLAAAMERALKQLESLKSDELSKEASEAVSESMKLASMEFKQLAQNLRDLNELDKALQALQMAKKLNNQDQLDGEACEDCESMSDYAELYAEMMAELGYDLAMGEGGEGRGERDEATDAMPEDESAQTDFKDEESRSTIQKGKILLSFKTKGVSEKSDEEMELQYQAVVRDLKQSVSEAIDQEEIPPGYHEGIKKYFDSLDETAPQ